MAIHITKNNITEKDTILQSIIYSASVGFANLEFVFKNYPSDWDGICLELTDKPDENEPAMKNFSGFNEKKYFPFRPANSIVYSFNNEIVLKDIFDSFIYKDYTQTPPTDIVDTKNISQISKLKITVPIARVSLSGNPAEEKRLYFAPYHFVNNKKYIGKTIQIDISPGTNFIDIIGEGDENLPELIFDTRMNAVLFTKRGIKE